MVTVRGLRPNPRTRWTGALFLAAVLAVACGDEGGTGSSSPAAPADTSSTAPASPEAPAAPVRILPLGDSITQADARHDSYRRTLFLRLRAEGYEVDFIGSQRDHHGGPPPRSDFDTDHEGHWGWRVDQILEHADEWFERQRPDVVLVHLGSNDVFQGQSLDGTIRELEALIDSLRSARPGARVALAQILPTDDEAVNRRIRALNESIAALAEAGTVVIVDQFTGFDASRDTYDGVHPNAGGEIHMAERFFEALEPWLTGGEPAS